MPLYAGPKGARPETEYDLSAAASAPVSSNGGKTYTIHLKPGLKWSNGQPITSKDVLFFIDVLKAGLKASPANWGQYVPGEFPTSVDQRDDAERDDDRAQPRQGLQPGLLPQQPAAGHQQRLPDAVAGVEHRRRRRAAHQRLGDQPGRRAEDLHYLAKQGGSVATFASNPLWKVVSGPFSLKSFSATNSSYVLAPNPSYGGSPKPIRGPDRRQHLHRLRRRAQRDEERRAGHHDRV